LGGFSCVLRVGVTQGCLTTSFDVLKSTLNAHFGAVGLGRVDFAVEGHDADGHLHSYGAPAASWEVGKAKAAEQGCGV